MANIVRYVHLESPSGDKYYMTATFNVSYIQSGSPTRYAIESGTQTSDHYNQQQDQLNISGSVSTVKFARNAEVSTDIEAFKNKSFFRFTIVDVIR